MTDTLIDANVLIDIFAADPDWRDWSARQLSAARRSGRLIINQIVAAEVAASFPSQRLFEEAIGTRHYDRENLPWEAAYPAARAFLAYRRTGGQRRSPLPDFYIGGHAEVLGYLLLTRDPARYRTAFPTLKIVSPETDP
jgi:predicted nucleic acid-binding protein